MADPNPKYSPQNEYNKYQDCDENGGEDCVCCPIGTVAVTDDCGNIIGCLTPNDAEHYNASQHQCAEGYVKLIDPSTGEFLGCVVPTDLSTVLAQLSPTIDPVPTPPSQEAFNVDTDPIAINGSELTPFTDTHNVAVDRIEGDNPINILMSAVNPPPAGVTITGTVVTMLGSESNADVEFAIDNSLSAGVYNFDIQLIGGATTRTLAVTLTLT